MSSAALHPAQTRAQLAAIAGDEHTQLAAGAVVVAPASAAEIAAVLRCAQENRLPVTPTGAGTKLHWGNPVEAGIVLSLKRLNAVREHSWQDMTCTVEAGCPWSSLQTQLQQHGQMVALDPLWPDRATVAGVAATNDSGVLRHRYGSLRDLILGMTLVLGDGTIAKTGGKVVKNVAGYDLHKLLIGSFGTLGVIAEINFRLHPIEMHVRTFTARASCPQSLAPTLRMLLDAQFASSAIQIRSHAEAWSLDVRIAARPECIADSAGRLQQICAPVALTESGEAVWEARQELFARPGFIVLKISTLPSDICPLLTWLGEQAAGKGAEIAAVAQAGGLLTVALRQGDEAALAFLHALRARARLHGGSMIVLGLPAEWRGSLDVWGCDSNAVNLMRAIKQRFDPYRLLNPGRFVENL